MAEVNRKVLARIRGCRDDSPLEGAACTNQCEFFDTCNVSRTPLLIQAESSKVRIEERIERTDNVIAVSDLLISRANDEYINILFEEAE